ncbi:TetR/AcrR family transcriptional regulator [Eubacteriales bacterium mix99]|jgi:AcrR family transcriptional regulator|nr:TetR family transcriptional regulator [Clostridiales bacterium]
MARPVDEKNREEVKEKIMETARKVFCEKGFINVTMTDLLNAAGMSRGGFYFYYRSVDEVFRDTVRNRNKSNFDEIRLSINKNPDFTGLIDSYFAKQKKRLLNMEDSLLRAFYEYLFTHMEKSDIQFRNEQSDKILGTVNAMLQLGVRQKALAPENVEQIAEHYMYTIEGLNVMALFQGLTEETIDRQFKILKNMISEDR